jgi:hypothetical protein
MSLLFSRLVRGLSPVPILIACASGGARDPNVITAPELGRSRTASSYDLIRRVRPEWLRIRQSGSVLLFAERKPLVAIDNTLVGGIEVLRAIPTAEVARMEFVGAREAATKYGAGFGNGIVLVEKQPGLLSSEESASASLPVLTGRKSP